MGARTLSKPALSLSLVITLFKAVFFPPPFLLTALCHARLYFPYSALFNLHSGPSEESAMSPYFADEDPAAWHGHTACPELHVLN